MNRYRKKNLLKKRRHFRTRSLYKGCSFVQMHSFIGTHTCIQHTFSVSIALWTASSKPRSSLYLQITRHHMRIHCLLFFVLGLKPLLPLSCGFFNHGPNQTGTQISSEDSKKWLFYSWAYSNRSQKQPVGIPWIVLTWEAHWQLSAQAIVDDKSMVR